MGPGLGSATGALPKVCRRLFLSNRGGVVALARIPQCVPARLPALQVRYLKVIEKSGYTALPWVSAAATPCVLPGIVFPPTSGPEVALLVWEEEQGSWSSLPALGLSAERRHPLLRSSLCRCATSRQQATTRSGARSEWRRWLAGRSAPPKPRAATERCLLGLPLELLQGAADSSISRTAAAAWNPSFAGMCAREAGGATAVLVHSWL